MSKEVVLQVSHSFTWSCVVSLKGSITTRYTLSLPTIYLLMLLFCLLVALSEDYETLVSIPEPFKWQILQLYWRKSKYSVLYCCLCWAPLAFPLSSWLQDFYSTILDVLTPEDVRVLVETEDEFARRGQFERVFPSRTSMRYLRFFEQPRYFNILTVQWEQKYFLNKSKGKLASITFFQGANFHTITLLMNWVILFLKWFRYVTVTLLTCIISHHYRL